MNNNSMYSCATVQNVPFMPVNPQLANAYVPFQMNFNIYNDLSEGYHKGTIFPDLYSPYEGKIPKGGCLCCE